MGEWRDVVVFGAGPGGSAAAHYLARGGVDVLLVDKAKFPREKTCGDGLTPRAVAVLHDMGVLDALLRAGQPISGVEIVSPDGYSIGAPVPSQRGVPASMLVVPRITLGAVRRERAVPRGARSRGGFVSAVLDGARQAGPAKSYPLRVDFPDAPTFGGGMLLVGEAAGLVNPLTGEGIDYALESAQIAAEHAARGLAEGTLSLKRC